MAQIIKNGVEYNFGSSNTDGSSMEVVTRAEYDTLVANGTVKTGVYYFITEDNGTPEWVYDESTGKITGYKTKIGGADTVFPFSSNDGLYMYLGSSSGVNVGDFYEDYQNLTVENFAVYITKIKSTAQSTGGFNATASWGTTVSYNASTGILSWTCEEKGYGGKTVVGAGGFAAFLIL